MIKVYCGVIFSFGACLGEIISKVCQARKQLLTPARHGLGDQETARFAIFERDECFPCSLFLLSLLYIFSLSYILLHCPILSFFSMSLQPPSMFSDRRMGREAVLVSSSPFLHYVVISRTFQEGHGAYMGRACGKGIQRGYGVLIEARISA